MSKRKFSNHHVVPKSRGGKHTCAIPKKLHESWHHVFSNLTPEEACAFVREFQKMMMNRNEVRWKDINALRDKIRKGG